MTGAASALDATVVLDHIAALRSPSPVVLQLVRLARQEDCSTQEIEDLIRTDVALAVVILSTVNSAMFGTRRHIGELKTAIQVLGRRRLSEIAIAAAFRRSLPDKLAGYGIDATRFWLHNAACAIFAEELARAVSLPGRETAFTAGLLHDCGKLVVTEFLRGRDEEVARGLAAEAPFIDVERAVLGTDHARLGELVIQSWGLPSSLGAVARHHHEPSLAPDDADRALIAVVHVANVLAHSFGLGADKGDLLRRADAVAARELGATDRVVESVAAAALPRIDALSQLNPA